MTTEKERGLLLARLVENPETVICIHVLRWGDCNVYMPGDRRPGSGAVLQPKELPMEPVGFGADANALWRERTKVKGWQCILVDKEVAASLGEIISSQLKTRVCLLDYIYHIPQGQILSFDDESVHRFLPGDIALLEAFPREAQPIGFWGELRTSLTEGLVAGAVVEGLGLSVNFRRPSSPSAAVSSDTCNFSRAKERVTRIYLSSSTISTARSGIARSPTD